MAALNDNPFDLVVHLHRQRAFSIKTFGPGMRTKGVVDHIRKELCEIEEDPSDLSEWIDVILLAFDGAWRAGWRPEEITLAIDRKQRRNEERTWPNWRTSDPDKAIEHDRSGETAATNQLPDDWLKQARKMNSLDETIEQCMELARKSGALADALKALGPLTEKT